MAFLDLFRTKSAPQQVDSGIVLANNASRLMPSGNLLGGAGLSGFGGVSAAGIPITPYSALSTATSYACVRVLAESIASLPIMVEKRQQTGGWTRDEDHPLNDLFREPNSHQNAYDAVSYLVTSYALRGEAFVVAIRDRNGAAFAMLPVVPDRVSVMQTNEGDILFSISDQSIKGGAGFVVSREDCAHIKNISLCGLRGVSPLAACANAFGVALAIDTYGQKHFQNAASVSGIISIQGKLAPEALQNWQAGLKARHSGIENAGSLMLLDNGATFTPMQMNAEEAQFIASRGMSVAEICRIFNVPGFMVNDMSGSSYNTVEAKQTAFADTTLRPIVTRIEQEFERVFLFADERKTHRIRFDFSEMLRGDTQSRYAAYAVGLSMCFLNPNEVRAKEGLPPRPGGDEFFKPGAVKATGDTSKQPPAMNNENKDG